MALSGSYDFLSDRDSLIRGALRIVGALAEGQTPSTQQYQDAAEALNYLVKSWQAEGVPLWVRRFVYVLPMTGLNEYLIGPGATSYHAVTSYNWTTLAADAALGASTITVTSASGISSGDKIGIDCGGTMFWTTVNGAPAGAVVTLQDALTAAANAGAYLYTHSASAVAQKPLKVLTTWRCYPLNNLNVPMNSRALSDILSVMNASASIPVNWTYIPSMGSPLPGGTSSLFIWPRFYGGQYFIQLDCQYPVQDIDSSTDNPDIPQEFLEALKYGLAVRLAPEYGYPLEDRMVLKAEAEKLKEAAFNFNVEEASLYIQPEGPQ